MLLSLIDEQRARDAYGRLWVRKDDRWEPSPVAAPTPLLARIAERDGRAGSGAPSSAFGSASERRG